MKRNFGIGTLLAVGVALLVAGAAGACYFDLSGPSVKASGKLAQENRTVGSFDRIEIRGTVKLDVKVGSPASLRIEADDNILPLIETEVTGGALRIGTRKSFRGGHGVLVTVVTPTLSSLEVAGACSGKVRDLAGEKFEVEIAGAGSLEASGAVDELRISVAGSGSIDTLGLKARRADVNVAGAGKVQVNATENLIAKVSGVGDVRYTGSPAKVEQKILGVGRIEPL